MLVKDFLKLAYKSKKDGSLSKLAITFMVKHNLKEEQDVSEEGLILISLHFSSKEKRIQVVTELLKKSNENKSVSESKCNVGEWRKKSYKQIAKVVHPDASTGDTESFQFLQEIKEYLWNFKGEPRKEIGYRDWVREKLVADGWRYNTSLGVYEKNGEVYRCKKS